MNKPEISQSRKLTFRSVSCASILVSVLLAACSATNTPTGEVSAEASALEDQSSAASDFQVVDEYAEATIAAWDIPGLAVGIVSSDEVLHVQGYGVREFGKPEPVDGDTIFAVGSMGKTFTSVMIGAMQDDGLLAFDDPISEHFSGFKLADTSAAGSITIGQGLAHVSGLPGFATLGAGMLMGREKAELVGLLESVELANAPGERFEYTNVMYVAAALAAEAASGQSYDALLSENVLTPLGMSRTAANLSILDAGNVASPHIFVDGAPEATPYLPIAGYGPAGSLNTTVNDLTGFVQMMMNNGAVGGQSILSSSTSAEIQSLRRDFISDEFAEIRTIFANLDDPERVDQLGYSYGLSHLTYNGVEYYMHGGGIGGMTCWMMWSQDDDIGVIVLSNSENFLISPLAAFAILNTQIDVPIDTALTRLLPLKTQLTTRPQLPPVEDYTASSLDASELAGEYSNANGSFRIIETEDGLEISLGSAAHSGKLTHYNDLVYSVAWDDASLLPLTLEASLGEDGSVTGLQEFDAGMGQVLFLPDPLFLKDNTPASP